MVDNTRVIRVPNLPLGRLVDENGHATDDFLTFLQALTTSLQVNFGSEGLVMPTQSPSNVTIIQDNQNIKDQYTCALGTLLYEKHATDYTQDAIKVAVRNDNTYPITAPLFKTFTIT